MQTSPELPEEQVINPFRQYYVVMIPQGVVAYKGISPGAKLVYGRLYRYAGKKGVAFPSIPELSEEVGLGKSQTKEYLAELVENKFIQRERVFAQGNVYRFLNHPCLAGCGVGSPRVNSGSFPIGRDTGPQSIGRDTGPLLAGIPADSSLLYEEGHRRGSNPLTPLPVPGKENTLQPSPILDTEEPALEDEDVMTPPGPSRFKARSRFGKKERKLGLGAQTRMAIGGETTMPRREEETRPGSFPGTRAVAQDPPNEPAAPQRDYAALWNSLVSASSIPADPVKDIQTVRRIRLNPDLDRDFEKVCRKAQELLTAAPDEVGFISFSWLVRSKDGRDNWDRMLHGGYDWMTKSKNKQGKGNQEWLKKYMDPSVLPEHLRKRFLNK